MQLSEDRYRGADDPDSHGWGERNVGEYAVRVPVSDRPPSGVEQFVLLLGEVSVREGFLEVAGQGSLAVALGERGLDRDYGRRGTNHHELL
ncbi:hypothetical protein ACIG0A_27460 [Streptomyces californicus]|uniref:hypothetical protein n=1 Tax=Streptomyces californicus TaxID=67351 RepID=UPI0037CD19BB